MDIKGALMREIHQPLTIENVTLADPGPDEVSVKTVVCGVCHIDLHALHGAIPTAVPTILGHEPAGIVQAVGKNVRNVEAGDHVIACTSSIRCEMCPQCLQGLGHLCTGRSVCQRNDDEVARIRCDGETISQFVDLSGFAEAMLLHHSAVVRIDHDIPLDRAALVDCAVTTGVGAALKLQ